MEGEENDAGEEKEKEEEEEEDEKYTFTQSIRYCNDSFYLPFYSVAMVFVQFNHIDKMLCSMLMFISYI